MVLAPVPSPAPAPGAIPPQNLEAEESVLGAMMISPLAIAAVSEIVDASDFYRESHAKIYRAALALYSKNEPVDAITLTNELEQRGELEEVGGRVRLHELSLIVPASANAGHYAEIVRETATLRGLIRAGGEIAQLGWEREGEPAELVARPSSSSSSSPSAAPTVSSSSSKTRSSSRSSASASSTRTGPK